MKKVFNPKTKQYEMVKRESINYNKMCDDLVALVDKKCNIDSLLDRKTAVILAIKELHYSKNDLKKMLPRLKQLQSQGVKI